MKKNIMRTLLLTIVLGYLSNPSTTSTGVLADDTLVFQPRFYSLPRFDPKTTVSQFGPKYPVTSAWFRDRYSLDEWNKTLMAYQDVGGDTVMLRAPNIVLLSRDDFMSDPNYQWCRMRGPFDVISCYDEAIRELIALGLNVEAIGKYDYEENYGLQNIIRCPAYEKRINTSRIYHRLVLPMDKLDNKSDPCNLNGSRVMVLFTSFAGIDPHELLLQTAHARNVSVYFGLPQLPVIFDGTVPTLDTNFTIPHLELSVRVLRDHQERFTRNKTSPTLYNTLKGYCYSSDILLNIGATMNNTYRTHFVSIGESVQMLQKSFVLSTYYRANKLHQTTPLSEYLTGFEDLAKTGVIDVIAVRDGRGYGNGAYFWPTQLDTEIATSDAVLHKILRNIDPEVTQNATYRSLFSFSIQEIFYGLAAMRDELSKQGTNVDLWLNIEAFDFLQDDPCLPVDKAGSGISQIMNRVMKSRLDHVLTHAGAYVSKVISDAWDPCYTCKASYSSSLASRIKADHERPIIANCSFHSSFNRSVVIIGYNLLALTQSFTVTWPDTSGHRHTSQVYGYYFEIDWGKEHGRVPSLMYTQLYDPYDVIQLAPKGWVHASADGGYNSCSFTYDFTREADMEHRTGGAMKKYYLKVKHPKERVYGQNVPFSFQNRRHYFKRQT